MGFGDVNFKSCFLGEDSVANGDEEVVQYRVSNLLYMPVRYLFRCTGGVFALTFFGRIKGKLLLTDCRPIGFSILLLGGLSRWINTSHLALTYLTPHFAAIFL